MGPRSAFASPWFVWLALFVLALGGEIPAAAAVATIQPGAVSLSADHVERGGASELRGAILGQSPTSAVDLLFRISDPRGDTVAEAPVAKVAIGPDRPAAVAKRFFVSKLQAPGRYEASIIVRATDTQETLAAATPAYFTVPSPPQGPPRIDFLIPSTERAGQIITLAGDNLDGVTQVMFGAVAAREFTRVSPYVIKAKVPDGAALAPVSVSAPRGTGVSPRAFRPLGPAPLPGLTLAWHDEFDGDRLDSQYWNTGTFYRHRDAIDTPEAIRVSDGNVTLSTFTRDGQHYTGYLDTAGKYLSKFGYIEARIRFHDSPGEWSAFWMLNWSNNGKILNKAAVSGNEVDIAEHRYVDANDSHSTADAYDCALSYNGYGGDTVGTSQFPLPAGGGAKIQDEWHVYGVLWKETGYTVYFDGRPQWTFTNPVGVSRIGEFLLLTSEVQDHFWAGDIPRSGYGDANPGATRMDVSWVRVWR
jgi:beta-glucanase (GH16 family)